MVRRKAAISSVTVYTDEPNPHTEGDNDDNDASQHLPPPPRKKTRLHKEPPSAAPAPAPAPRTRRAALKEKATNPSSSDNSYFHSVEQHDPFRKKLQNTKQRTLPDTEKFETPSLGAKKASPLHQASIVGSPVHRELKKKLPSEALDNLLSLMKEDAAQEAADLIARNGCWCPELLNCFRASALTSFDFSSPSSPSGIFIPHLPPSLTLQVLFQQHQFSTLAVVSFRNTPLLNDDVAFLRLLPCLSDVDISNTNLGTQSLHHLVCHRHTLKKLNLSHNSSIDDDSRVALSAFPNLVALYLRGTSFTMPGLRRLVLSDLNPSCRLLSIPAHCIEHLNTRQERYVVDIPVGHVQDPDQVPGMTIPNLKRNLELHAKVNKDVQITGTKLELVNRLSSILSNRIADLKIVNVLGRV